MTPPIHRSLLLGIFTFACGSTQPVKVEKLEHTKPVEDPFPWPESPVVLLSDPACEKSQLRVRAGLALEQDFWFTAICIVQMLPPTEVDAFIAKVKALRVAKTAFVRAPVSALPADLAADLDANDRENLVLIYATRAVREKIPSLAVLQPHLGFGTWRGICLPWQEDHGHSGVTSRALLSMKASNGKPLFSARAMAIVIDASQDPDLFDWDTPAAHAQTQAAADAMPANSALAQEEFVGWVRIYVRKAADACRRSNDDGVREALYWLGYATHAVEDLAPHLGRTNPEHAYNADVENFNPDAQPLAIRLAEDIAGRFLKTAMETSLKDCADGFGQYQGGHMGFADKRALLDRPLQLSPAKILEYKASSKTFAAISQRENVRIRWFGGLKSWPEYCARDETCKKLIRRSADIEAQ